MSCTQPRDLVHAYLDHELDLERSLEVEQHLRACAVCSEAYEEGRRLRARLGEGGLYFAAPADLRQRIREAVREPRGATRPSSFGRRARAIGLSAALAAAVALSVAPLLRRPSATEPLLDELVSAHVRSLMADHLTDVASSDRHTVKPWFDGKLDFSPTVVDLADRGFPLVGGRLEYLRGRPAAALVYARRKHYINLFVWPSANEDAGGAPRSSRGFNSVHWNSSGATYWAVSDLSPTELEAFARLVRERARPSAR